MFIPDDLDNARIIMNQVRSLGIACKVGDSGLFCRKILVLPWAIIVSRKTTRNSYKNYASFKEGWRAFNET